MTSSKKAAVLARSLCGTTLRNVSNLYSEMRFRIPVQMVTQTQLCQTSIENI